MAKYVILINWTERGIKDFQATTERAAAAAAAFEKAGGSLTAYWTVGAYDLVAIAEAPDDETATAILLQIGSRQREDADDARLRRRRDGRHHREDVVEDILAVAGDAGTLGSEEESDPSGIIRVGSAGYRSPRDRSPPRAPACDRRP